MFAGLPDFLGSPFFMDQKLSLLEFNNFIKETIQMDLGGYYWVVAEVASLNVNHSGHCYIELVEKSDSKIVSKARATIWANQFSAISSEFQSITGETLKQGMNVLSCLTVRYHEIYGLSFNIVKIDPGFTLGQRAKSRAEVINRLQEEGLIKQNKELDLVPVPQSIAIISSETAAGYEDFINQTVQNPYGYAIKTHLFPAVMQGNDATNSIISALSKINQNSDAFDCIVIIRGGGSQLDLDCFDTYELAVEIAHSELPVITGIGHQRDDSVADIVSYQKVKTPTAAAEFLLDRMRHFEEMIMDSMEKSIAWADRQVQLNKTKLSQIKMELYRSSMNAFQKESLELRLIKDNIKLWPLKSLEKSRHQLELLESKIAAHNPEHILKKGYTITTSNGKVIQEMDKIKEGDLLETLTRTGKIISKVTKTENHE